MLFNWHSGLRGKDRIVSDPAGLDVRGGLGIALDVETGWNLSIFCLTAFEQIPNLVIACASELTKDRQMTMNAFVPPNHDRGGRGNDGSAIRANPSTRPALRHVVRMEVARPGRSLWKNQLTPGNVATTMAGGDNNEMQTEDRKFRFWRNNRGDNLSKRVENRTGQGERGTSELCPRRRGKFQVRAPDQSFVTWPIHRSTVGARSMASR
jgi:hypothetical protein